MSMRMRNVGTGLSLLGVSWRDIKTICPRELTLFTNELRAHPGMLQRFSLC